MIIDDLGRTFGSLRISLTDLCNLACTYCTADSKPNPKHIADDGSKTHRYLEQVKRLHELCRFKEVRLTGGEPLLFKGIDRLVGDLLAIGIPKVKLTTNGTLLKHKAKALKDAGLENVNISLDCVDENVFETISRRHSFGRVLEGIEEAQKYDLSPKINMVVMNGVNEGQIVPMFEFFRQRDIRIRYLEFMQMGELRGEYEKFFYSQKKILEQISRVAEFTPMPRPANSTANYWETTDGYQFGIIANTSRPFCNDCDRLRIGSDGKVYGCLSNPQGFEFDPAVTTREETITMLENALGLKQRLEFSGSELSMKFIGG